MIFCSNNYIVIEIIKLIFLILITYFFMSILTKDQKKISIVGTIVVCCSTAMLHIEVINAVLCGEAIIVAFHKLITSDKLLAKIISTLSIGPLIGMYLGFDDLYYNGYELFLCFTYIAIAIWIILENKSKIKFNKKAIVFLLPCIIVTIVLFPFVMKFYNTHIEYSKFVVYHSSSYNPQTGIKTEAGVSIEPPQNTEKSGLPHLFSYTYSMFLLYGDLERAQSNIVYSSFLSIFPLSLILAMVYVYKKQKHLEFLMPMVIVIAIEAIICMLPISIFKNLYIETCASAVGLGCVYLYIYMISNIEENVFKLKTSIKVVLALLVFYFLIPRPETFVTQAYMYILSMVITLLYFLFINFADIKYKKVLLFVLAMWSIISIIPIASVTYQYYFPENKDIVMANFSKM